MPGHEPARLLRIHLCEADMFGRLPAYEALVNKCRELGIAGATVLRGVEGYGDKGEVRRPGVLRHDRPLVVIVVDQAPAIERLVAALEHMEIPAMIAMSDVRAVRVRRSK